jgi:hypothetical protein
MSSNHASNSDGKTSWYHKYLREGYPIATGVIEGACRHVIEYPNARRRDDRFDGARWRFTPISKAGRGHMRKE